jgi:FlaG/FlaF family flagellin (archaellin)
MARKNNEHAISPVVGVMLMLVVTIIIAAVVSGFAGGVVSGQKKVPQATIQGEYSISQGLQIIHAGGDSLPTSDVVFIIKDGPTFGQNMEERTTQILNMSTMTNSKGTQIQFYDGGFNVSSFNPGDTFYINAASTTCNILQPMNAPYGMVVGSDGYTPTGNFNTAFWALCIRNNDNVGKQFILEVDDKSGHVISSNTVTIAP